jgi:hypothetical protein
MLPLRPSRLLTLRRAAAVMALAAGAASMPALAGQVGTPFTVTILFVPGPATCTAGVSGGVPQVLCGQAGVVSPGSPGGSANGRGALLGYRLPDTRMKVAGALVGVGEESFQAWGEYSSRFIRLGDIEYLEMTVTW